jgi:hypothetical protein
MPARVVDRVRGAVGQPHADRAPIATAPDEALRAAHELLALPD